MKYTILAILVFVFVGCTPGTQVQTFVDPSLSKLSLETGGITVLPVGFSAASQKDVTPELRRQVTIRVTTGASRFFPSVKTIPIGDTLAILEGGNLLDAYVSATSAFEQTGILRAQTLDQITTLSKTRYALYPYLYGSSQQTTNQGLATTYSSRFGIVLWDKQLKKAVYEGTQEASVSQNVFTQIFSGGNSSIDGIYAAIDASLSKLQGLLAR